MSEVRPSYDDEIDFFEFFETLWDGKWLITAFVAIAVLLGGSFILLKDAEFESKIFYSVDTLPPFYEKDKGSKASADFNNKFYSVSVFEEWKQNNSNTTLLFEDFRATKVVDGFVLSKNEDDKLVTLEYEKKGGSKGSSFVLIKSNQLPILDDFFEYTTYINELLKVDYLDRAKEELKIIEARFKVMNRADSNIVDTVLSIDRYIVSAEKGASVLAIDRPTLPKKVSPKSSLILVMSIVLGGMVGVFFILVRNANTKRKKQLAKG